MKLTEEMIQVAQEFANEQRVGISIINDTEFNSVTYAHVNDTPERLIGNRTLATVYPEPIVVKSKPPVSLEGEELKYTASDVNKLIDAHNEVLKREQSASAKVIQDMREKNQENVDGMHTACRAIFDQLVDHLENESGDMEWEGGTYTTYSMQELFDKIQEVKDKFNELEKN